MKFKRILKESQELQKLEKELSSGKWIVKKPFLYRGASSDFEGKIQIKHTSQGDRVMDWEFPDERITLFFFDVEDYCYPEHPKHRNSRHCTTVKEYAEIFGDELYIIFPSKDSKIGYFRNPDTVVNLFTSKIMLEELEFIYKERDKIQKSHRVFWVDLYNYFIGNENINLLEKYGCLDGMVEKVRTTKYNFYSRKHTFDLKQKMQSWVSFKRLQKFFENQFKIGYPPSKASGRGDEVLVGGEILKVHLDLWQNYSSKK